MAGFAGRELEFENDFGKEINDNYEAEDVFEKNQISHEEELEYDIQLWEDDIRDYLEKKDIIFNIDTISIPIDRKIRLHEEYFPKSIDVDDYGHTFGIDRTLDFYPQSQEPEEALKEIGIYLGKCDAVGDCYKLLSIPIVAENYWASKYLKAIEKHDDSMIKELKREIEVYDPDNGEKEFSLVVDSNLSYNDIDGKKITKI